MSSAVENLSKPQILAISEKCHDFTPYDVRWIPCSAKYLVLGMRPNNTGIIQIYELTSGNSEIIKDVRKEVAFKCSTFGASSLKKRQFATGNFAGRLEICYFPKLQIVDDQPYLKLPYRDLENWESPVYQADAHDGIINSMDGFGGQNVGCGAPEIVTGSRDGLVKVWDPRQKAKPVVVMEPTDTQQKRDCWSVTFGNAYNNEERMVCAGYDNGDIKMYDLRNMSVKWETNIKNGVCSLEFDRREIEMNKLVATTLESKFFVWDLRTHHPTKGFTCLKEKAHDSTVWLARHLPQNREIFMTTGGNGTLCLWKYNYPIKRWKEDMEDTRSGVMGSLSLLQNSTLTTQPIASFHWCPEKIGLAVTASFDQAHRIVIVTKLNSY